SQGLEELKGWDTNDYLLGWKNVPGAYRYCHSFTEAEIDALVESVASSAPVISRFSSDGRGDKLNTYLLLQAS
ncbi:MAG: class I SAM-dependent methyltransferase, partial [Coriobacteriales bacterium]|nr:class I SAM-dependent methyltransferase [Coriobacteriales bacterium]